jgi:hypothetical protein
MDTGQAEVAEGETKMSSTRVGNLSVYRRKYYCPAKGGQELTPQFMEAHKCLRKQRKNRNKHTHKREFFRCPRLVVV